MPLQDVKSSHPVYKYVSPDPNSTATHAARAVVCDFCSNSMKGTCYRFVGHFLADYRNRGVGLCEELTGHEDAIKEILEFEQQRTADPAPKRRSSSTSSKSAKTPAKLVKKVEDEQVPFESADEWTLSVNTELLSFLHSTNLPLEFLNVPTFKNFVAAMSRHSRYPYHLPSVEELNLLKLQLDQDYQAHYAFLGGNDTV
ncbi:hypothetical protein GEMRC1_003055 [Eukaryota sp. GEM-RC1]